MNNLFTDPEDRESYRLVAVLVAMHGILSADPQVRGAPDLVSSKAIGHADAVIAKLEAPEEGGRGIQPAPA